jgi:hypothetical protein
VIDAWDDTRLVPGTDWKRDVEEALDLARAAILLVSADFLASDFIVDNELQPLLRAAEQRGTVIIPVVVRPCRYTRDSSLSRIQAINDPSEPLAALEEVEQERLYDMIAEAVEVAMRPIH